MAYVRKLTDEQIEEAVRRYAAGERSGMIAKDMGVNTSALSYHFRKWKVPCVRQIMKKCVCRNCGIDFEYIASHASRRARMFCSQKCRLIGYRGKIHGNFTGSYVPDSSGYVMVERPADHFPGNGSRKNSIREHVLKAERALGRQLGRNEVVHHINGNRADNRNCNLLICDTGYHMRLHFKMSEMYQKEHF